MPFKRLRAPAEYVDALDRVLDKGIMIDASGHVSVFAVDLLRLDVRLVVASSEIHLRHGAMGKESRSRRAASRAGPDEGVG